MTRDELEKMMANYSGEVKKLPTLTEEEAKERRKAKRRAEQEEQEEQEERSGYRNDVVYRYHPTWGECAFNSEGEPIC